MVSLEEPVPSRPVVIVGPTAVGKSDLAVELALRWDGEVVNADSMQLYRGMDIGTAKLTTAERRGVPHHLLDVWEVSRVASVADYQLLADDVLADLAARHKPAIVVGGSGLYVRALLGDLVFPGTDPTLRAQLEREQEVHGAEALHARLAERDAQAAATIPASNLRRVVRALEVVELTGAPFSLSMASYAPVEAVQLGLTVPRPVLDERIERRVERMWELGFVEEVRRLAAAGLREGATASRAMGYAQVLRHLGGEFTQDEARAETIRATRRYVRRQETWFRRDPRIVWLEATEDGQPLDVGRLADLASRVAVGDATDNLPG
jgi:tRNA dimethylallyltransferase